MSISEWRRLGFDKHSVLADPLFEDPENGFFNLPDDSPAFKIGFREFPLDKFGPDSSFKNLYLKGN
jgi:hypothetical protein